jgi:2-phospho-L-lactate guanylyltransferase
MMGPTAPPVAVLMPVKGFHQAKARLAPLVDPPARAALARELADRVVVAAQPLPVAIVCDDEDVASWAEQHGAEVVWRPGRGLNGAVEDGVAHLAAAGVDRVIVAHADLPLAQSFDELVGTHGIVLVPDRHDDGTNVIAVPAKAGFRFHYGPRSFVHHQIEARRLGLDPTIVRSDRLGWDIDTPADLELPDQPRSAPLRAVS